MVKFHDAGCHIHGLQQCLPLAVLKLVTHFSAVLPSRLQQCLPLAVLKQPIGKLVGSGVLTRVATVLTACGIETFFSCEVGGTFSKLQQCLPLAVLKLLYQHLIAVNNSIIVATVLTACGIETIHTTFKLNYITRCNSAYRLRY